jgi:hypothetical protein
MVEAARLFNIKSTEPYLFWCLRTYVSLPLPEYWTKIYDPQLQVEIYHSVQDNVRISVRPCYAYIQGIITNLREYTKNDRDFRQGQSSKMTLQDKLGRNYELDLGSLIRDVMEKKTDRKNQTYHYMIDQEDEKGGSHKKGKKNDSAASK